MNIKKMDEAMLDSPELTEALPYNCKVVYIIELCNLQYVQLSCEIYNLC